MPIFNHFNIVVGKRSQSLDPILLKQPSLEFKPSSQKYMFTSDAHPSVCTSTMANNSGGHDVCDCHLFKSLDATD